MKLFVYGTLKEDECRGHILSKQERLEEVVFVKGARLVDLGSYPGLLITNVSTDVVQGELYNIRPELISELDLIEGVAHKLFRKINLDYVLDRRMEILYTNILTYEYYNPTDLNEKGYYEWKGNTYYDMALSSYPY